MRPGMPQGHAHLISCTATHDTQAAWGGGGGGMQGHISTTDDGIRGVGGGGRV